MARAGNARDNPAPNSLCAEAHTSSPDACGSYSNTKTCRGDSNARPANVNADSAYADSCTTDSDPYDDAHASAADSYTYTSPTDSYANPRWSYVL
jgi:hypothetical protein